MKQVFFKIILTIISSILTDRKKLSEISTLQVTSLITLHAIIGKNAFGAFVRRHLMPQSDEILFESYQQLLATELPSLIEEYIVQEKRRPTGRLKVGLLITSVYQHLTPNTLLFRLPSQGTAQMMQALIREHIAV